MDDDVPYFGAVEHVVLMHDHVTKVCDCLSIFYAHPGFREVMENAPHHFADDGEIAFNRSTQQYIGLVIAKLLACGEKREFVQTLLDVYKVDGKITPHKASLALVR